MTSLRQPIAHAWRLTRRDHTELLDLPGQDPAEVAASLADLRRINRWLGGITLTLRALDRLVPAVPPGRALTVVDVATGGGDIPLALLRWAERRRINLTVVATDLSPDLLRQAVQAGGEDGARPATRFAVADGRQLPLRDAGVDVALCSLVVHHLAPDDVVRLLGEMRRVARLGVVVNDLVRGWYGLVAAWLISRPLSRITRHDAPASVRRAYTQAELTALAARAGIDTIAVDGWLGYRVALSGSIGRGA